MPRVQAKGQVTLETGPREEVGIRPGDEVELVVVRAGEKVEQTGILVVPKRGAFGRWRGSLRRGAGADVDAVLRELRGE
jgi:bifunctional DNA-binding transcriptional regulator/antitoxin component of YhaV-PrlF toxin-antitoxin module